jgi:N-acetyl-gamma-glutamyl-phosphate reductase
MKIKAAIIGATGYTGFELIRILSLHKGIKSLSIISRKNENTPLNQIYPSFNTIKNLNFETLDIDKISEGNDVVFAALPHKASMKICSEFLKRGKKVIDLSADFRFDNISLYEKWYAPHTEKDIAEQAVYGLPEIFYNEIKNSSLIANPGCYPTSAILALYPVLKERIKINDNVIVDSKSGVTGAGRNPSLKTIFTEVHDSFSAYSVGSHRHEPEIEEKLSIIYGKPLNVTFTPHLLPINRGILSTVYIDLHEEKSTDDIYNMYTDTYKDKHFIKVLPLGKFPSTAMVKASNYCFIGINYNEYSKKLIVVSVIDNIVKGASGQAVQNMNIMFGMDEKTGLEHLPTFL